MNIGKARRVRHFLRLSYPVQLVQMEEIFVARHLDLPGCQVEAASPQLAYAALEVMRRDWIVEKVLGDEFIGQPNHHLQMQRPEAASQDPA